MQIEQPCVVSLEWTLADGQGDLIDKLDEPVEFFYGGDDLLPKVEEAIAHQSAGFEVMLHLEPEHAFGEYHAEWVCFEDRALFPDGLREGLQFEGLPPGAKTQDMPPGMVFTLTELYPEHVVLDGNHPLAGMALQLALKVVAVRPARADELERRSVSDDGPVSLLSTLPAPQQLH